MPEVIFLHGLESGPHGSKYQALQAAGFEVVSPDCRGKNLAERVAIAEALLRERAGRLVIGSSYGGLTALHAAARAEALGAPPLALLLLAPALGRIEAPVTDVPQRVVVPTRILHGSLDEICPLGVSEAFAARHPALVQLEVVEDGHRLADSMERILALARELTGAEAERAGE